MRLFKYAAVIAVATAGKKFETNEEERACMSACKDRIGCHGYTKSEEGPPECITECREECTAERKENIKSHLSLRTQQKAVLRRTQNKQRRLQHRMGEKNKNPKPNIKEFHQLYEDGEVPRRFIACLKNEREKTNCEGHGKDMWPCKRDMVESCLDRNDDFANLGSARLVVLIQEFREGLKAMRQAQMMNDVQVTTEEPATENPHAIMGVEPNGKNKVKVNSLVKALKQKKEGKVNYLADGKVPEGEKEEEEEPDYEPEYEEEPEEEEERDYEEEPEERPAMQNDWSDLNQIVEWEEPVEPENEERHREAIKNPQALYSYVGNGGSKKVQGGKNNKAQLAKKESHTKLPFVKRISKGESSNDSESSNPNFYSETDSKNSEPLTFPIREEDVEESDDRDVSQTVSLPYPIRVEELDESEDAELEFSTLLADQSASDRAHDDKATDEVMERLGIPRPLNGPITIVNDKYILLNSLQKRMWPPTSVISMGVEYHTRSTTHKNMVPDCTTHKICMIQVGSHCLN